MRAPVKPAPSSHNHETLLPGDVPDHAATLTGGVTGLRVHAEIINRLALIGPLLAAIIAGDDFKIAHVSVRRFGFKRRPVHRAHGVTGRLVGLLRSEARR